ncbi:DISARM system phospholipase D-like protein DrmC [Quadrisphaera sp. KR29]|uniref:DISARM system phospholipase D-like protein DrmC n=1 Tax=Quadrisphaera sp. KR29 TaxID=3461391 RepID=UPI004044DEED
MTEAGLACLEPLAALLGPSELRRVADGLDIDRAPRRATRSLAPEKRDRAEELVRGVIDGFGNHRAVAAALRAIASTAERVPPPPTLVWSSPQLPGDSVRTTSAIVRMIDDAEESVLASTYSGGATAPFVEALARAAQRRVRITVVADVSNCRESAEAIGRAVPRVRMLGFYDADSGQPRLQHSKVLVIDGRIALVTSANLSYAAVEKNLEAGLLVHGTHVASQITRRFADLVANGNLRSW